METINTGDTPAPEKSKGHIRGIWAILIIIVAAILVGGGIWYWYYKTTVQDQTTTNTAKISPSASPTASGSASALPSTSGSTETTDWKTYTNSIYGFSIKYPLDWEYKEFPPSENEGLVDFTARFNKTTLNKSSATSQDYVYLYIVKNTTLENEIYWGERSKECQVSDKTIANLAGKKVDCSYPSWNSHSYIVVKANKTAYHLKVESDKNKSTFDKMISTFKFL